LSAYETLKNIFKVIYSPFKAFKGIIQNPKYIGPILIMILFVVANAAFVYTLISKTYVEQTLPTAEQQDRWTENYTLWTWTAGANATDDSDDFINGTYYGNKSIEFSMVNSRQIWMQLSDIGTINCLGSDGYKDLSLRVKVASPEVKPENVTIYLFSTTFSDYFYHNLTETFSNFTYNVWNNLTVPLGSDGWLSNNNANWGNITGLKLEFTWLDDSNITLITLLVDGLFFRGVFKSLMESAGYSYLLNYSLSSSMRFIIEWFFLSALLYIMTKAFGGKIIWKILLITIGFALITIFVQTMINVATYVTLPNLYYRLELIGGVEGESQIAYEKIVEETWLVSQISSYVQMGLYVWTITLCALVTRLLTEFSWTKSFLVAAVAYFASMVVEGFILG
jgi:hypothetical protein